MSKEAKIMCSLLGYSRLSRMKLYFFTLTALNLVMLSQATNATTCNETLKSAFGDLLLENNYVLAELMQTYRVFFYFLSIGFFRVEPPRGSHFARSEPRLFERSESKRGAE